MNGVTSDKSERYDVCVVGGGPVGSYLTMRLAQAGINVCAFEALSELPEEPRAFAHLPGLFKEFAKAGILEKMKELSVSLSGVAFRRKTDLQIIEQIRPKPGQPRTLALPQKRFTEEILLDKLREFPSGRVLFGHKVVRVHESGSEVKVEVEDVETGSTRTVQCQYLVGADGARSMVRGAMGIKYEGTPVPYKLIAADVIFPFEKYDFEASNFLLDGEDFGAINYIRKTIAEETVWRVSTAFPITMSDEEVLNDVPNKFPRLMGDLQPGRYQVLQVQPYKAHQSCTPTMLKGRMMLIGDAAHLANPYSGQLLASGIFAASSLAECLTSILRHGASTTLLEEWNEARMTNFKNVLDPLSRKCMAAVGNSDVETIGDRHPFLMMIKLGPRGGPPQFLETDVTKLKSWPSKPDEEFRQINGTGVNGIKA